MSNELQVPADLDELLTLYDERFVRGAYLFVLGRPADDSGFAYYLQRIRDGIPRHMVIVELGSSEEAKKRSFHATGLQELLEAQRSANPFIRKVASIFGGDAKLRRRRRVPPVELPSGAPSRSAGLLSERSGADGGYADAEIDAIFRKLKQALQSRTVD